MTEGLVLRTPRPASPLRPALLGALVLGLALVTAAPAWGRKGDTRFGLFVGTTTASIDGQTTFGTNFGGSYGLELEDDLLWTVGASFATTEGEITSPAPAVLRSSTAAVQSGLTAFFNRKPDSVAIPFVGAGLSLMNYDFVYPGTNVGTTSGTGPGAFAQAGVEFRLSRNFTLIPQFGLQVHSIKSETGATLGLLSGGLVFTFRITG
jgi:hypothetical protein